MVSGWIPSCSLCFVIFLISFTESLGAAPCIQTVCGHIFHFSCLEQKLSKKWPGSRFVVCFFPLFLQSKFGRITFNFLSCPLCKQTIDHPSLRSILEPHLKMLEEIRGKAKQVYFSAIDVLRLIDFVTAINC